MKLENELENSKNNIYNKFLIPVYGDTNTEIYMKLCKKREFVLFFRLLFDYKAVLKQSLSYEEMALAIVEVAHEIDLDYSQYSKRSNYHFKMFVCVLDNLLGYLDTRLPQLKKNIRPRIKKRDNLQRKLKSLQAIYDKENRKFISLADLQDIIKDDDINNYCSIKVLESVVKANGYVLVKKQMHFGPKERLENLLLKYRYNYQLLSDECKNGVATINIDKLDKDLAKLKSLNILLTYKNLSRVILEGLGNFDDRLKALIIKGYIDNTFINKNIDVLLSGSQFNELCNNIDVLVKYNIDIGRLSNKNASVLLSDNNDLKSILSMYSLYNIEINDNNISNVLDISNLDLLDSFIEEGCYEFIRKNANYLCCGGNELVKRIHINSLVGEESIVNGKLDDSLQSQTAFFVPDCKLDEVWCNKTSQFQDKKIFDTLNSSKRLYISEDVFNSDYIKKLDEKYLILGNYNINGIIISRIKLLRNMEALKNVDSSLADKIFNSMIYNSMLTTDEIYALKGILSDNKIKKMI